VHLGGDKGLSIATEGNVTQKVSVTFKTLARRAELLVHCCIESINNNVVVLRLSIRYIIYPCHNSFVT
jgi:hypothetical protein